MGFSVLSHEDTATALQPSPARIAPACSPPAPILLKSGSDMAATLDRIPDSSSIVKNGKKIRAGGSMTERTVRVVPSAPSIISEAVLCRASGRAFEREVRVEMIFSEA